MFSPEGVTEESLTVNQQLVHDREVNPMGSMVLSRTLCQSRGFYEPLLSYLQRSSGLHLK